MGFLSERELSEKDDRKTKGGREGKTTQVKTKEDFENQYWDFCC